MLARLLTCASMSTDGYMGSTDCGGTLLAACGQGSGVGDSVVCEELVEPLGTLLFTAENEHQVIHPLLGMSCFIRKILSPIKLQWFNIKTVTGETN